MRLTEPITQNALKKENWHYLILPIIEVRLTTTFTSEKRVP